MTDSSRLERSYRRVYAGTRQPLAHPDDLVTPLSLDVTSRAQIQAAAGQVESLDMRSTTPTSHCPTTWPTPPCSNATWPSTSSGPTP